MSDLDVLEEIANDAARRSLLADIEDTPPVASATDNTDGVGADGSRRRLIFESDDEQASPPPPSDDDETERIASPDPSDISSLSGLEEEDDSDEEYASTFTGLPLPNPDTRREFRFVQP